MHLRKVVECCFKLKKSAVSIYCREESLPVLCDPRVQESQFQFDLNFQGIGISCVRIYWILKK